MLQALAGGAIGSILVGFAWALVRLYAVPGEVDRHDDEAAFIDDTLALWIGDEYRYLRQEVEHITNDMAARGLLHSGIHGIQRSEAKTQFLHRYRDRLQDAKRERADLYRVEAWPHAIWRRWARKPPRKLTVQGSLRPVIDDVRRVTTTGGSRVMVHDPTRSEVDDLLDLVRRAPLEPA